MARRGGAGLDTQIRLYIGVFAVFDYGLVISTPVLLNGGYNDTQPLTYHHYKRAREDYDRGGGGCGWAARGTRNLTAISLEYACKQMIHQLAASLLQT